MRVRLTALYCLFFFPSGVILVFITYFLIAVTQLPATVKPSGQPGSKTGHGTMTVTIAHLVTIGSSGFIVGSCIVLVAMIATSVLLGWLAAGRVLRPLRNITTTTRQISEHNLQERLGLVGPDDELKELSDTIDGLLARLETAFESQQRFVANASHELRTPLMLSQTLLQVALADPYVTLDSLRAACQDAVESGKDLAELIDALLILARSQRGLEHRESIDLTAIVNESLRIHGPSATARGLQVDATLDRAEVSGDARLIYRLVSNLADNAIRYNLTGGWIKIDLAASTTGATLTVVNSGLRVATQDVSRLLQPFQRASREETTNPDGLGLGLSIVAQIVEAHGAELVVTPRPDGGLTATVTFSARLDIGTQHSGQPIRPLPLSTGVSPTPEGDPRSGRREQAPETSATADPPQARASTDNHEMSFRDEHTTSTT